MGDLSDIPDFSQRRWYRRRSGGRALLIAAVVVMGMVAWCLSSSDPADDITVSSAKKVATLQAHIGSPYSFETTITNSGPRTAKLHLQLALFIKESSCLEAGKRLPNSFTLPMDLSVSPNGTETVTMQFDSLTAPCDSVAGVEVFADGKTDLERFSLSRKLDAPAIKLL